ncbi:MAG TPA: GNAT family N-acetyltransferase [Dehalococcoidia bacterium]|nr:GNAT family N-acetyltransferase [Dehalococcoidia bacterium]
MRAEIQTLGEEHLEAATRLLADRHRRDRTRNPALSARFESAQAVRPLVDEALAKPVARGVAALQGGDLVGFLIGTLELPNGWFAGFLPRRSGQIGYAGYAAAGENPVEIYRELYAALAPFFLDYGAFNQSIEISAGDETATEAWSSLGFGRQATLAVRDVAAVEISASSGSEDVDIRRVGPGEIDDVVRLGDILGQHHNSAPIFLPYLPEETNAGFRTYQMELLEKPENAHWVAYRDGTAVGMQTFHEPDFNAMARPERSTYLFIGVTTPDARGGGLGKALLKRGMDWARDEGYEHCTLHFLSANTSASRFWLGSGFVPLSHELSRNIDERVAWANTRNER